MLLFVFVQRRFRFADEAAVRQIDFLFAKKKNFLFVLLSFRLIVALLMFRNVYELLNLSALNEFFFFKRMFRSGNVK